MSRFSELSAKIRKKRRISKDRADAITYSIGVKKYGRAGMAAKAAAGRRKAKRKKGRRLYEK